MKVKRVYGWAITLISCLMVNGCSLFGSHSLEEPEYTVGASDGDIEVREYAAYLIVSTVVQGDFDAATSSAFRRLAAYIGGANRSQSEIAMTAPVIQEQDQAGGSEEVAMTAPVIQEQGEAGWMMAFVVPSQYTLRTVPQPTDPNVSIEEVPGRTVAVLKYSGRTDAAKMAEKETQLREWLAANGYETISVARSARYDPPWTIPWFRRNEVHIEVEAAG